jgi:hypothetical protein
MRLPLWLLTVLAAVLVGCSSASSGELHTPSEATSFIVAIARGGSPAHWHVSTGASAAATRVWSERATIADFGSRLRRLKKAWACEFAEGSAVMGDGKLSPADIIALTQIAERKGAKPAEISPLLTDVLEIYEPDLAKTMTAVCGQLSS